MGYTVGEIAKALGAECAGDGGIVIERVAEPSGAGAHDIALAVNPKFAEGLEQTKARAAILWPGADWKSFDLEAAIFVGHARFGMADLTSLMDQGAEFPDGIHPSTAIDPSATIGANASLGPFVSISSGVKIGKGAKIGPGATIGRNFEIGENALIHAGVKIAHDTRIGDNFIVQPGAVIGSDGFSFVPPEGLDIEATRRSLGDAHNVWPGGPAKWRRTHSLGGVDIGDDVEIGANTTIDRGTIRATRIGRGSKLDNLVHIAHNVEIGEDTLICASVSIAGSTKVGNRCVLGGQVGVNDNITIGDDVIAAGATKIFTNAASGRVLMGSPATKMQTQIDSYKAVRRLPRLFKQVSELQKRLSKLDPTDET